MKINKVVVIGSGTMGSGIAAQLCNANVPVTLLDLTTEISEKARERILKSRPPLLIDKSKINNINVGNINDNFNEVSEADWIVEAVVERIDIKHNIYEKIFKARKSGAIVSSNTSSIPIKILSEKLSSEEKKDFEYVKSNTWTKKELLFEEFKSLGFYISDHPLNEYSEIFNQLKITFYKDFLTNNDSEALVAEEAKSPPSLKIEDGLSALAGLLFLAAFHGSVFVLKHTAVLSLSLLSYVDKDIKEQYTS